MTDFWHKKTVLSIAGAKIQKFEAESKLFPVECWKICCKWLICSDISICVFCIWLQKPPLESFFDIWKSGHFRSRSFSVIFKNDSVIMLYSIYKLFILYYKGRFAPPKRKWPKMTVTDNDRIRLLKVIRKRIGLACKVMIISLIVAFFTGLVLTFNTMNTHRIPFALSQFSCSFYENLDKIYQGIPCFTPFILPFTPLVFAFWGAEKCHRSHFFLLLRAFFSSFLCKKLIQPFLLFLLE